MKTQIIAIIGIALVTLLETQAAFSKPISVCYQDYREELVTAAITLGQKRSYFQDENVQVILNSMKEKLSSKKSKSIVAQSNLSPESKSYYRNATISEVDLLRRMIEMKCDFVSTTFEGLMASNINLKDVKPVAVYKYGEEYDTHFVVRKGSSIKSVEDLKGRTVRVNQIGGLIPFERMLSKAGMTPDSVIYEKAVLADITKALDSGYVDAVLSYSPTIPLLLSSGRVEILESNIVSKYIKHPIPHSLLIASKAFIDRDKKGYERFTKAFIKSAVELSKKPEETVYLFPHVSGQYSNLEVEKAAALIKIGLPMMNTDDQSAFLAQNNFIEYAALLKDQGFLKNSVDFSVWQK